MPVLSKKTLSALALSVAAGIGLTGYAGVANAAIEGNTSTDFTATVHIISDNKCTLTVTPPDSTLFDATWTRTSAVAPTTIALNSHVTDPIKVVAAGGAACSLNTIKISAGMQGIPNPSAINGTESRSQLYVFGNSGGAWAILPSVSQIQLYTDDAFTTAGTGTVTGTTASGLVKVQSANIVKAAGTLGTDTSTLNSTGLYLADTYFSGNFEGLGLTDNAGNGGSVSFTTDKAAENYKSAKIFIGGAISSDPLTAVIGEVDKDAAANGDTATMPFMVTISEG